VAYAPEMGTARRESGKAVGPAVDLSIVVVSYNVRELLRACLESVFAQQLGHTFDLWVVDNASADGSAELVRASFPHVQLIANADNRGFAAGNNQAIHASTGRHLLFLNPDTEILSGSLDRMIDYLDKHADTGILGCRLVYPDGSLQHSCFHFPGLAQTFLDLFPLHPRLLNTRLNGRYPRAAYQHEMDIDHCLGACFMLRRATRLEFDEAYFMYVEEIDLCWRLKDAGWKIHYLPDLTVLHHAGGSARQTPTRSRQMLWHSRRVFTRKHRGPLFRVAWGLLVCGGRLRSPRPEAADIRAESSDPRPQTSGPSSDASR